MYRQTDGYPSGHGKDLADFLSDFKIVNGISLAEKTKKVANGMECLAAQIVAHFKPLFGVGGIYLHPARTRKCNEQYIYIVTQKDDSINISCKDVYAKKVIFSGTAKDLKKWAVKND